MSKLKQTSRESEIDEASDDKIPSELEDYEEELSLIRVDTEEDEENRARGADRLAAPTRDPRAGRRRTDAGDWVNEAFVDFMSKLGRAKL